jgi:glycerol-3-phosphate dehydrogenase subunit B
MDPRKNQNSIDLASYLDDAYPILLEKLRTEIKDYECLVFPAVLGLKNHLAITEKIKETFGIPVFEVPTLPPSLPGIRLSKALSARIHSLGGDMFVGYPVKGTTITGNKCTGLIVDTPGRPRAIEGENYILATGGIVGEGIAVERGGMKETVFGLPVTTGLVTSERCFFQSHGYAKSGIRVNSDLRPIGPEGKIIFENVFCAGRTLVGYDPFTEFDGAGVAIVTGYKAAHAAIRR